MDKNPYIDPIIDIDTVYQQNKALLYERKSKTKKEHTWFDVWKESYETNIQRI